MNVALADEIEQAAGRGDEDVDARAQRLFLRGLADAAKDDGVAIAEVLAVDAEAVADLRRELARRRQDQDRDRAISVSPATAGLHPMEQWQRECRGLSGAGLRQAEHVTAFEDRRDRLLLNGSGSGVALFADGAKQRLGEAELVELGNHLGSSTFEE